MNLQLNGDMWNALQSHKSEYEKINSMVEAL